MTAGGRRATTGTCVVAALVLTLLVAVPRSVPAGALDDDPGSAPRVARVAGADRVATAVAVSRRTHDAAEFAVVTRDDEFTDALTAAPLAHHLDGPLLLTDGDALDPRVRDELERLGVAEVVLLGGPDAVSERVEDELSGVAEVRRVAGADRIATAVAVADELPATSGVVVVPAGGFADAVAAAPVAAHLGWPLLLTRADELPAATRRAVADREPDEVLLVGGEAVVTEDVEDELAATAPTTRRGGVDRHATAVAVHREAVARGMTTSPLWLATSRSFPDALAAGSAVAASKGSLLLVDGDDLRTPDVTVTHLRPLLRDGGDVVLLGGDAAVTADADWQLEVVRHGHELPRGGLTLFPRHRMVAFYGSHRSPRLGVLGEQPPEQAYDRLAAQARGYDADGRVVLPTFELITDVAQSGPGPDGDYSSPSTVDEIRPWLDAARRDGVYLLLDIQPGRSDFLTLVRRYDELLREPDVGVALDPEWRMDPDEVPGRTVGEVDAEEVNAVADHLAAIVREHHLPQKLLVVHQFQTRMVERKHLVEAPAELSVMFHMDGQGGRAAKRSTYRAVQDTTGRFSNGFKLFYDEDVDMFAPADVLGITPVPDFVSYQ